MKVSPLLLVIVPLLAVAVPVEQATQEQQTPQAAQNATAVQEAQLFWALLPLIANCLTFVGIVVAKSIKTGQIKTRGIGGGREMELRATPFLNLSESFDGTLSVPPNYPYHKDHDVNRPNHQDWKWGGKHLDFAYCLHVRPGARKPQAAYLPANCTALLHAKYDGKSPVRGKNVVECGHVDGIPDKPLNQFPEDSLLKSHGSYGHVSGLRAYLATTGAWNDAEHCRAGCETCFDAMAEFGAEQAVCRRRVGHGAKCGVGVVRGPPPVRCKNNENNRDGGCQLEWERPRWIELRFETYDEAVYSAAAAKFPRGSKEADELTDGDVRTYYVFDMPEVGAEVAHGWGKRETVRRLLTGWAEAPMLANSLWETRTGMWYERDKEDFKQQPETPLGWLEKEVWDNEHGELN